MADKDTTAGRFQRLELETEKLRHTVEKLEKKQVLLVEGLKWAANEVRPIYGMSYLGKVLDGIADRLAK